MMMESDGIAGIADGTAENITGRTLGKAAAKWFQETRHIDPETASDLGIYSERRGKNGAENIVYPYVFHGEEVNRKYRGPGKSFSQDEGGKQVFYNADILDDEALKNGDAVLAIAEGENDVVALKECGYQFAVSVPGGAPQKPVGERPVDDDNKYKFIWDDWERLKKVKRIILMLDNDAPGRALGVDLLIRFGAVICSRVQYPEGCKDINDVLIQHGKDAVWAVINNATPYPVTGLYDFHDYRDTPAPETFDCGLDGLGDNLKLYLGSLMVVTGYVGSGKSTVTQIMVNNICERNGWKAAVGSFESRPVPHLRDRIRHSRIGKCAWQQSAAEKARVDKWIGEHLVFIDHNPPHDEVDDADIEWVLDRALDAVTRYGIKILLIDPWNEIEHKRGRNETETEYTSRALRLLRRFAVYHNVLVIIVAHPTKPQVGKKLEKPTLYSISGSANWNNKPDFGLVVWRPDKYASEVEIHVDKVRESWGGKCGIVEYHFNVEYSRYELKPGQREMERGRYDD